MTCITFVYMHIIHYFILYGFWPIHILKTDKKIYIIASYIIWFIYNIGRAALEQAYKASASETATIFIFIYVKKV